MHPNSLDLLLATGAIAASVAWWRARSRAKTNATTIASRDRLIGEKNERLTILANALDAERGEHRSTTNVLDTYITQSVILAAKLAQAEQERDDARRLGEQLTRDLAGVDA